MGLSWGVSGFLWPPSQTFNANLLISLVSLSWVIYFVGMTYVFGCTIGKMITGCLVVNNKGEQIKLSQALVREILKISGVVIGNYVFCRFNQTGVSFIFLVLPLIIMVSILLSRNRNGLHDKLSKTIVVRQRISLVQRFNLSEKEKQVLNKFTWGGIVLPIALLLSIGGFTSSRLFNMLMGGVAGFCGACIGVFVFYFMKRIKG